MSAETLLARLERVRSSGPGKWRACCPVHGGKSLTLAIAERDGRVLLHCFAGCGTDAVLRALGLTLSDLFERPLGEHRPMSRSPWSPRDVLQVVLEEATVVGLVAAEILERGTVSETDWLRLRLASGRLVELANVVQA